MEIKKSNSCHCVWLKTGGNERVDLTFIRSNSQKSHRWINKFEPITSFSLSQISIILFFFLCRRLLNNTPISDYWWLDGITKSNRTEEMTSIVTLSSAKIFCITFLPAKCGRRGKTRTQEISPTSSRKCCARWWNQPSQYSFRDISSSFFLALSHYNWCQQKINYFFVYGEKKSSTKRVRH